MSWLMRYKDRLAVVGSVKTIEKAQHVLRGRSGLTVVSVVSFVESALPLPLITDPFLIAAILTDRAQTIRLVIVATITSVLGGLLAYFMALYFFELVLTWMTPGMTEEFHQLSAANGGSAFVLTLLGAVTPVPYTIVAWAVAALKESLWLFVIGSVIGRSFRYIVVGYSTYRFGDLAISYAKRYIGLTSVVLFILAGLFLWLKM